MTWFANPLLPITLQTQITCRISPLEMGHHYYFYSHIMEIHPEHS